MDVISQCRLCLKIDSSALSVFDDVDKHLTDKIYECFNIQIKQDDPITQKLCRCCYYFTNSVYKYRIVSKENELKLKKEYEEKIALDAKTNDKSELTQNDFLNNLKLTNNTTTETSETTMHKSIINLKRKFPTINIPECCNNIDMEPFVDVLSSPKRNADEFHLTGGQKKMLTRSSKPSTPIVQTYKCSKCLKYFTKYKLRSHKCFYICPTCMKTFVTNYHYQKHILSHQADILDLQTSNNSTDTDDTNSNKESQINNEIKTPEKPTEISVETKIDELNTPNKVKATEILNTSPGNLLVEGQQVNAFVCLTCNKVFDTRDSLKSHKLVHKLSLRCDKCPKKFTVVEALMKHQKIHVSQKRAQPLKILPKVSSVQNIDDSSSEGTLFIDVEDNNKDATLTPTKENKSPLKLPQLSVTLKPLTSLQSSPIKDTPNESSTTPTKALPERGRIIARKHTDGALFNRNSSTSTDNSSSLSSSSSDEDDCEITEVSEGTKENVLDTALEPQKIHPIEFISTTDIKPIIPEVQQNEDLTAILIIDSDSDSEVKSKTIEPTEILSSGDETSNKNTPPRTSTSTSDTPIIIASPEENTSTSITTKVKNEINYINYLFNKCSSDEYNLTNGTQHWNLQRIKQLARRKMIPIEINRVREPNVTVKYIPRVRKKKFPVPLVPWGHTKVIDLNGGKSNITSKSKQLNSNLAKTQKAAIKFPIPATVKPKIVNGPKTGQFVTKYVPSGDNIVEKKLIFDRKLIFAGTQSQENIPNNTNTNNRSVLKNVQTTVAPQVTAAPQVTTAPQATTPPVTQQPIVYTYVATPQMISNQNFLTLPTTSNSPTEQFVLPIQQGMNKNTIILQQQPNFINITQPTFFATTDNTGQIYLKQPTTSDSNTNTSAIQPAEVPLLPPILQPEKIVPDQEQMNEVTSSVNQTNPTNQPTQDDSGEHRPMIRIKKLSELTASSTTEQSKDELNSYLNAYTNYVSTRT